MDVALPAVIRSELILAREFLALLKEEESALVAGDTDHLSIIVQSKSAQIQKIVLLVQERDRLQPLSEMPNWLEDHPESATLWQDLLRLSEEIKQTNDINGAMIDTRLRSTQQALNMLQTLASRTTSLYGPDGQASIPTGSSSIDSA